ncbi:hypothetical protein I215_13397 [Galbibacter marinus]|uniref:Uncharacterized protein n=1 Tax=Galbibacter marinus TaxID=555500 RepID=K2QHN8_9FLAO|nr:hypothetical protein [Galbibacter marinus]EKF54237.1 hypothetical protein I215_13397 [Galbibacter marinus]
MKTNITYLFMAVLLLGCNTNQKKDDKSTTTAKDPDTAALLSSERHHEWVDLKREQGPSKLL